MSYLSELNIEPHQLDVIRNEMNLSYGSTYGIYREEEEIASLTHKMIQRRVELQFFADQASYHIAKQADELTVPAYSMPVTGISQ
ncbi:hypothetical protein [Paenibacillus bouchesdurhonensis]|uniref:hypothetical protein n=1 Tax=Paenibacillus bouchesdurhonensis TaxID=1870990 RepID=UPI000DA63533|nr:hypothetical protein [Paenibacillus bouchesdurhonensis]